MRPHSIFKIFGITTKNVMLYSLFWVIPWRLNFKCRRFGTLCLFHLHRWCKQEEYNFQNTKINLLVPEFYI